MWHNDKFLTLAVKLGKISEDTRKFVLNNQQSHRKSGEQPLRVGEILLRNHFINEAVRDEILREQGRLRDERSRLARPLTTNHPSLRSLQLVITLLAAVAVVVATYFYGVRINVAIAVATFSSALIITVLQYLADRSISLTALHTIKPLALLIVLVLIAFAAVSLSNLGDMVGVHPEPELQGRVRTRLYRIVFAVMALAASIIILLVYSAWKYQSLRFAESRMGAMKDIIIRVEEILGGQRQGSNGQPAQGEAERQRDAIAVVLKGLRNIIRLSSADWAMKPVRKFFRHSVGQTGVLYFEPAPDRGYFYVRGAAYPEQVPDNVLNAYKWIEENHYPRFLNEPEFEKLKRLAKGENPRGWKKRYLNFRERHEYISVCGWIYAKQQTLNAGNASECLAFDNSFIGKLRERGIDNEVVQWVDVRCFIGCPIIGPDMRSKGVLLVFKNVRNGLAPEDLEVVIIASQLLGRILHYEEKINAA